jgi:hypothetical protein
MPGREEFWRRWSPWRHGEAGQGNFADVMRVLRIYEIFAEFVSGVVERVEGVTVLDLACGAAALSGPLARTFEARGGSLRRYVGVDFTDPEWMPGRIARELERHGLSDRGEYLHHNLAAGLPSDLAAHLGDGGTLVITSCWGITYLAPAPLRALVEQCAALAAARSSGAVLCVNMLSSGQFNRQVLTRRFVGEIVPRHLREAVRGRDREPVDALRLAVRALPRMREFGDELQQFVGLLPVDEMLDLLRVAGYPPSRVDATALWGQTTSLAVPLPGATR